VCPSITLNSSQSKYLDNHWSLTKICVNQFKGTRLRIKKAEAQKLHQRLSIARDYDAVADILGSRTGEEEFREIEQAIALRPDRCHNVVSFTSEAQDHDEEEEDIVLSTPPERENPEPPSLDAPRSPAHALRMIIPAGVSGHDAPTPTPGGGVALAAM
jgi:tRNA-dihydrouridine synthase 2